MQLTLTALENVSQFFGSNSYVMFTASTPDGQSLTVGVTENYLTRVGADILSPDSLVGCKISTKEYVDNRTGEIVNVDSRISDVVAGNGRIVLFNPLNANIVFSDLFKAQRFEANAAIQGRVKAEFAKEKRMQQQEKQLARLAQRNSLKIEDAAIDETPLVEAPANAELSMTEEEAF